MSKGSFELTALEFAYPWIKWREPVPVVSAGQRGFGCRICLARHGLKGYEPPPFRSRRDAVWHLVAAHGAHATV